MKPVKLLLPTVLIIASMNCPSFAQAVGSIVECAPSSRSDWRRGVVVESDPSKHYMRVRVEPENGKTGGVFMIGRSDVRAPGAVPPANGAAPVNGAAPATAGSEPIHPRAQPSGQWFNQPNGAVPNVPAAPAAPTAPAAAQPPAPPAGQQVGQPPQTAPAQQPAAPQPNAKCACPPMSDLSGNGNDGIFKREIRDKYIINAQDIASKNPATINFKSFQIGAARPYRMPEAFAYHTGSPDGPGGREGTTVYPVHARFTVCIDFPGYPKNGYMGRLAVKELDNTYWCFKNTFGKWQCNLGTPSKLLESKYIDK